MYDHSKKNKKLPPIDTNQSYSEQHGFYEDDYSYEARWYEGSSHGWFIRTEEDDDGVELNTHEYCYFFDNQHNVDEPAEKFSSVTEEAESWFQFGQKHRTNGPARTRINKETEHKIYEGYYQHGLRHRVDGPSETVYNEETGAIKNQKYHLFDHSFSNKEWHEKAARRIAEPAVVISVGEAEYYLPSTIASDKDVRYFRRIVHRKQRVYSNGKEVDGTFSYEYFGQSHHSVDDLPALVVKTIDGTLVEQKWYSFGDLHRENGPAVIDQRGEYYFFFGKEHRLGGPSTVLKDGTEYWKIMDRLHRMDGPAVTRPNGSVEYWIGGHKFATKEQWEAAKSVFELYGNFNEMLFGISKKSQQSSSSGVGNMSETMQNLKSNFKKALPRTVGREVTTLIRDFIVNQMADKANVKGKKRDAFVANLMPFFESDVGRAMISVGAGVLLPHLKHVTPQNWGKYLDMLSDEFQQEGFSIAQGEILHFFMGPGMAALQSGVMGAIQKLASSEEEETSASTGVRVAADVGASSSAAHHEEERAAANNHRHRNVA